jgi:hypothetical protein
VWINVDFAHGNAGLITLQDETVRLAMRFYRIRIELP